MIRNPRPNWIIRCLLQSSRRLRPAAAQSWARSSNDTAGWQRAQRTTEMREGDGNEATAMTRATEESVTVGHTNGERHRHRRAAKQPIRATWRNGDTHSAQPWGRVEAVRSATRWETCAHCRRGQRRGEGVHDRTAPQRSDQPADSRNEMRRAASCLCLCVQHNQRIAASARRVAAHCNCTAPQRSSTATRNLT